MRLALRRHRPQFIIALVLLGAGVIGAYTFAQALAQTTSTAPTTAVLRWANEKITDLYTLDPDRQPDFNSTQAIKLIFGGLVRSGPGFSIRPDVASRWSVSRDGRTYTFRLRDGIRFGDGSPVTAADVVYSFNRALDPTLGDSTLLSNIDGAPAVRLGLARSVTGVRALDSRTVQIRLIHPDGSFLARLATPDGFIVPAARVAADPGIWDQHAVGTGPFMVSRWIHNDSLLLVPNPYYYGGKIRLTGIDMPFIPEPLAAYKQYRAGSIDIMGDVSFPTGVLYQVRGQRDFHQSPRLETIFLTLNERRPPFDDVRVRLAFARAVDKTALVGSVWNGFAHPTDAMMPPGLPGYNAFQHAASYDPALARRLLAQAGHPNGRGLPTITFPVDQDAQSLLLASALATQWRRALGVRVQLHQYTHSQYLDILTRLRFQIGVIDWTADFSDPANFVSQQLHSDSPNNNGGWSNPIFDRLVDRADALPSADPRRFALYRRAEQIAMSQAATIPLVNPTAGILIRRDVHGISVSGGYLTVRDWSRVSIASGRAKP